MEVLHGVVLLEWPPGVAECKLGTIVTAPVKMSHHPMESASSNSQNSWQPFSSMESRSAQTGTSAFPEARDRGSHLGDACAHRPSSLSSIAETSDTERELDGDPVNNQHWRPLVALQVPWKYEAPTAENFSQPLSNANAVDCTEIPQK